MPGVLRINPQEKHVDHEDDESDRPTGARPSSRTTTACGRHAAEVDVATPGQSRNSAHVTI